MKKQLLLFGLMVSLFTLFANASPIEVSTTEIDFGVVKQGTDKQETFIVTNTSNTDVTFMVDASTRYPSRFEVSENLVEITLTPGTSKIYTVTAHGQAAGDEVSTEVYVKDQDGVSHATLKLKSIGNDDSPLVDVTSLTLNVGERAIAHAKDYHVKTQVDVEDIVSYYGHSDGTSGGPNDGHSSLYGDITFELSITALKPGVATFTFEHQLTGETATLTITVLDPARPTTDSYAIYNYRNDDEFNAFLNMDVDSITYSKTDLNGRVHPNVVVQEVWTPDSVYRIPLAGIDSITFKAPEPVYKPDVYHITSWHLPYIHEVDELVLHFSRSIEPDSIPAVGQVVISDVFAEPVEHGFSGRVLSVQTQSDEYVITCEPVSLTDVFDRLLVVGRVYTVDPDSVELILKGKSSGDWDGTFPISLGKLTKNIPSVEGLISNEESDMTLGSITVEPKFDISYLFDIHPFGHSLAKVLFENRTKTSNELHLKVAGQVPDLEIKFPLTDIKMPVVEGLLYVDLALKGALNIKGELDLKAVFSKTIYNGDEYEWDSSDFWNISHERYETDPRWKPSDDISEDGYMNQHEVTFSISGSFGFGLSLDIGIYLLSGNTIKINNSTTVGPELSGSITFSSHGLEDGTLYSTLKDTKIKFTPLKLTDDVKFTILKREFKMFKYSKEFGTAEYRLFPDFTEPALPTYNMYFNGDYMPLGLNTKVTKDVIPIIPLKIGIGVYDSYGTKIDEYFAPSFYQYEKDWNNRWLQYDVSQLASNKTYKFCPMLRLWGAKALQVKAMPEAEMTIPVPVSLEMQTVSMPKDGVQNVAINGGWGDYSVDNSNPSKCSAELKKDESGNCYIQVVGLSDGPSTVTVKDLRSREMASLLVTVGDGQGASALSVTPTEIDFGVVELGTDKTEAFTVTNTGTGTLIFRVLDDSWLEPTFEIPESGVEHSLAPGASKNFTVISHGLETSVSADATVVIYTDADNVFHSVKLHIIGLDQEPLIAEREIYMQAGETKTLDVRTGHYEIVNGNEAVVLATRGGGTSTSGGGRYITYHSSTGHLVLNAVSNGTATVLVTDTQTGKNCVLTIHVGDVSPDQHEWVDLGLPSGTLWATCNVGASAPEEYGDYFAWGETEPKDYYYWDTYKWCNGSYNMMTKYCTNSTYGYNGFVDNKTELDPEDDAAYVNLGPSWRMPTKEQQRELYEKCSSVWTTQNGVNGRLFTGPNGNTLFLPAAGDRWDESLYDAGSYGYYWSRTLNSSYPNNAYILDFYSGNVGWNYNGRYDGFAVRAVRVSQN